MNRHLDDDGICRWLGGERNRDTEDHLAACAQCRAELDRMSSVLGGFHDAILERSERRIAALGPVTAQAAIPTRARAFSWSGLPIAAAIVLVLLCGTGALWLTHHQPVPARTVGTSSIDDAALFTRIDSDLSRNVPSALEPLAAPLDKEYR